MKLPTILSVTRSAVFIAVAAIPALLSKPLPVQAAVKDNFGQLVVTRERAVWPSPESVVRNLRSPQEVVRFKALLSLGIPEQLARVPVWSNTTPSVVSGSAVIEPEQIELRYAALGNDETQQAIVVAQIAGSYAFAAIAISKSNGWERIAAFNCWCKYDADSAADTFLSLSRAPDPITAPIVGRFELVLRASGGGTGVYQQNEVHFRLYRREMKAVMSFVSRVARTSYGDPGPPQLSIERRWFYPSLPLSLPDGRSDVVAVLVEGGAESAVPPTVDFLIRELQDRYLKGITCRAFHWNEKVFQYEPVSAPNACKPGSY